MALKKQNFFRRHYDLIATYSFLVLALALNIFLTYNSTSTLSYLFLPLVFLMIFASLFSIFRQCRIKDLRRNILRWVLAPLPIIASIVVYIWLRISLSSLGGSW